jgi:hypothetical protein
MLAAGCWLLAAGCWLLATGCWLLAWGAAPFSGTKYAHERSDLLLNQHDLLQ